MSEMNPQKQLYLHLQQSCIQIIGKVKHLYHTEPHQDQDQDQERHISISLKVVHRLIAPASNNWALFTRINQVESLTQVLIEEWAIHNLLLSTVFVDILFFHNSWISFLRSFLERRTNHPKSILSYIHPFIEHN